MEKGKNIKNTYPVLGMSCASCAARVDKTLNGLPGVYQATMNYATAVAQVEYNPEVCSDATLQSAVQDAGYDLLVDTGEDAADKAEERRHRVELTLRFLFVGYRLPGGPCGRFYAIG